MLAGRVNVPSDNHGGATVYEKTRGAGRRSLRPTCLGRPERGFNPDAGSNTGGNTGSDIGSNTGSNDATARSVVGRCCPIGAGRERRRAVSAARMRDFQCLRGAIFLDRSSGASET